MTAAMLIAFERLGVFAMVLIIAATWGWAILRMNRRARNSGYRYWLIDPRAQLAALRGVELPICFCVLLVGMLALFVLFKLA
jgi:hypothetical protein